MCKAHSQSDHRARLVGSGDGLEDDGADEGHDGTEESNQVPALGLERDVGQDDRSDPGDEASRDLQEHRLGVSHWTGHVIRAKAYLSHAETEAVDDDTRERSGTCMSVSFPFHICSASPPLGMFRPTLQK